LGRSNKLATFQCYFKAAWKQIAELPISGQQYDVDVKNWVCSCGQQKYQCHHLCKHLIHAIPPPDISFWWQVFHQCTMPLYCHPQLVLLPMDGSLASLNTYQDPNNGSITEGDDHLWIGDKMMLSGGHWHKINDNQLLRKHMWDDNPGEDVETGGLRQATAPRLLQGKSSEDEEEEC
jgi:hypothetical protein